MILDQVPTLALLLAYFYSDCLVHPLLWPAFIGFPCFSRCDMHLILHSVYYKLQPTEYDKTFMADWALRMRST